MTQHYFSSANRAPRQFSRKTGTSIRQDRLEESVMHSPKVLECGDGSNGGTVYDVATVVQHMTVYADLPHLRGTSDLRC